MSAAITDLLTRASSGTRPSPTTLSAPKAISATSLTASALTGWNTATAVHFCIYNVDANNNKIAGTQTDWKGLVSGSTITNLTLKAGTDNGYAIGAVVEAAPTAAWADDLITALIASHNQDGSLLTAAVQAALNVSSAGTDGWTSLATVPNTVTALGNRSFTLSFPAVNYTDRLTPGDRVKFVRTVAAPVQSTLLNGTTQFYSKTSPAGMTFTDDFVVSAWVKLTAYPTVAGNIASRWNGTSGWVLRVDPTGQVELFGTNASAANFGDITSTVGLPLNRWVHVAAQLDMSTGTATVTTSYVMFDGVNVDAFATKGGTNPVALIQAGNLEIGSANGGTNPFPGKIAQVAIYNAKVTQATILAAMNQTLVGTETNLISAYSFNNTINDLNANANNLTANGSAVATNADSPFAQGVTGGTIEYGIVTAVSFSTNTSATVQAAEGSMFPASGGITSAAYSTSAVPFGFPAINKFKIAVPDIVLGAVLVQYALDHPIDGVPYFNIGNGGGMMYLDMEGVKKTIRGVTASVNISGSSFQSTLVGVNFPTFLNAVQEYTAQATQFGNTQFQYGAWNTISPTGGGLYLIQVNGTNGGAWIGYHVTGI